MPPPPPEPVAAGSSSDEEVQEDPDGRRRRITPPSRRGGICQIIAACYYSGRSGSASTGAVPVPATRGGKARWRCAQSKVSGQACEGGQSIISTRADTSHGHENDIKTHDNSNHLDNESDQVNSTHFKPAYFPCNRFPFTPSVAAKTLTE